MWAETTRLPICVRSWLLEMMLPTSALIPLQATIASRRVNSSYFLHSHGNKFHCDNDIHYSLLALGRNNMSHEYLITSAGE